ncbi:MAG: CHAT domain-containing protein [Dongiaceae bacterium]
MAEGRLPPHDLSAGLPPFARCPACRADWAPTMWIVVDTRHRPDLAAAIRDGSLCTFRCASCARSIDVNAPFLAVRERQPRLLFSPSPGTTSLDDHNQLVHALGTLKAGLAGLWDDALVEEIAVVARPLMPAELADPAAPPAPADLVEALCRAGSGWQQQYLLGRHPGLLEPEAAALLDERIAAARQAGDGAKIARLRALGGMLAGCRRAGASAIPALLPPARVYLPTAPLNDLLGATAHAMRSGLRDAATVGLLEATRRLTRAENPLLWAELQATLAAVDAAAEDGAGLLARPAWEAVATAGFACGPWLALSADSRARLAAWCWEHRRSAADEEEAIAHYEAAAAAYEALGDGHGRLAICDALGFLHYQRREGDRAQHLEAALRCFQAGAGLVEREDQPGNWAAMQFNVGNAFLERRIGDPLDNLDQAIAHLERAVAAQAKLGERERLQETAARLRQAAQQRALVLQSRDPRGPDLRQALAALGSRDWEGALAAYRSVIARTEAMLASTWVEEQRREVFGDFGTAYSAAAYACFRLERFEEGIGLLEAGRSRLLSEELEASDIREERLPEPLREELRRARQGVRTLRTTKLVPTRRDSREQVATLLEAMSRSAWQAWLEVLERIRTDAPEALPQAIGARELAGLAPPGGALVLPVFSIVGCCVLVVPHGRGAPAPDDLLWLDAFTDNDLIALLAEWAAAQSAADRAQRRRAVTTACERLWRLFAGPVAARLQALGLADGAPVAILPQGGLGMLPLHAAAPKPGQAGGLLDAYAVSYAPSAYLLSLMQRRAAAARAADSLLGAVDPLGDLAYGRAEGALVAGLFAAPQARLIEGPAASGGALKAAVPGKAYLHLSCHAYYTTAGGNYAGLHLAHDQATLDSEEIMAVAEGRRPLQDFFLAGHRWIVLNLDLAECRLVTLSACESGRTDMARPDEFLGLPAAFLRAGAAAVACTLWRVDDAAAMLLARRLYEGLVGERRTPADALRQAQRWLRDATNRSLHRFYKALRDGGAAPLAAPQLERELRRHALAAPNERPYADPYYWAAFVVFGSG